MIQRVLRTGYLCSVLVSTTLVISPIYGQTLTWLGNLGGYPNSGARGVSPNGPTVVGWSSSTSFFDHAFRWTPTGGMQDLGTFGGNWSSAYAISADGTTIVGNAYYPGSTTTPNAFRWTSSTGLVDIGTLGGSGATAYGTSSTGTIVVGTAQDSAGNWLAFRYDASTNTMQNLGTLGGPTSAAYDVSGNGQVVVGGAQDSSGTLHAFAWTASTGMVNIGISGWSSTALGISLNGQVAVGWRENTMGTRQAVYRDLSSGVGANLGHLGGGWAEAYAANWDGSIIVGWSRDSAGNMRAFRWTSSGGIEDLNVTYAALLSGGSILLKAEGISPGGRYIVGQGYDARTGSYESAFLLDTCVPHHGDINEDGCVDDGDLLAVLFAFGSTGELGRVDVNCDGVVDDADLLIVLFNFGTGC